MHAYRMESLLLAILLCSASASAAEPTKQAEPQQAVAKAPVDHTYAPAGKRDPFKNEREVVLPPPSTTCGTLCEFDLEQLRLAAIVSGISVPLAGLEAPNGKVYIVDKGTQIGKHGGRVIDVAGGKIVVEEPCAKDTGKKCKTTIGGEKDASAADEDLSRKPR